MPRRVGGIPHGRAAVFCAIISQVTPSESSVIKKVAYEPLFLNHLRSDLAIKGICRVVMHERQMRSEEHTSELQSHLNLVCRLLLEKKKKKKKQKDRKL